MPRLASVTGGFAGFAAIGVSLAPPATGGGAVIGTLYIWGYNSDGQVGDSTTASRSSPTQIGSLSWTQIASGTAHTMAIRDDGLLFAWGDNSKGQLGDSTGTDSTSPVQIGSSSWKQVSTRGNTTMAIRADDTLWGWGANSNGQIGNNAVIDTGGITSWTTISSSADWALAIKYDGTLWAWGKNDFGQLGTGDTISRLEPVQIGTSTWLDVATSGTGSHTMAVRSDGTLWSWGWNGNYQLGTNDNVSRSSPAQLGAVTTWAKVAAGGNGSAAIRTDGSAYAWGYGIIPGNGVNSSYGSPVLVSGGGSWSKLTISGSSGNQNLIGINNGSLLGWGNNNGFGLFGSVKTAITTPTSAAAGTWTDCAIHEQYWHAVRNDGTLWWRGRNLYGSAGAGSTQLFRSSPVQVGADSNWSQVRIQGEFASMGTKTNNTLWFWGYTTPTAGNTYTPTQHGSDTNWRLSGVTRSTSNYSDYVWWLKNTSDLAIGVIKVNNAFVNYGQLGDGTPAGAVTLTSPALTLGSTSNWKTPQQVGTASWSAVSAGTDHTVAIDTAGNIWAWGNNSAGQVGDITAISKSSPVQVTSGTSWKSVDAGNQFTIAVNSANALYAWGLNSKSQLGDGTTANKSSPVSVGADNWKSVSAGYDHSIGINNSNNLYGWGSFTGGIITSGTWSTVNAGVGYSSGSYATDRTYIAVNTAGSAFAWGHNQGIFDSSSGQTFNGYTLVGLPTSIVTGNTWQKIIGLNRFSAVGLDTSGRIWGWGMNYYGELGLGDTASRSSPVQIGSGTDWADIVGDYDYVLALKTNGTLWAWGRNNYGQLGDGTNAGKSSPVQIGASSWTKITASWRNSAGIRSDGTLWSWGGYNSSTASGRSTPTQYGSENWVDIHMAGSQAAGVKSSGQAFVFDNFEYQYLDTAVITQFGTTSNWTRAWANSGYYGPYFAKNTSGQLFAASRGTIEFGVMGDGTVNPSIPPSAPVQIGSSTSWNYLASAAQNSMVGIDGTKLVRWGYWDSTAGPPRGDGSIGSGQDSTPYDISLNRVSIATPTQIGASTWKTAEAGNAINFVTDATDNLYAWGLDANGDLAGLGSVVSSPTAIVGATAKLVQAGDGTHVTSIR